MLLFLLLVPFSSASDWVGGSFEIHSGTRQLSMDDHLLNSNFSVRSPLRFILYWLVLFMGFVLLHFSRTLLRTTSSVLRLVSIAQDLLVRRISAAARFSGLCVLLVFALFRGITLPYCG